MLKMILKLSLTSLLLSTTTYASVIVDLAGDKDSFGTGKPLGASVSVAEILTPGGEDGDFDTWGTTYLTWHHSFSIPITEKIVSSTLSIVSFDMEDDGEGDGLGGGPYEDTLFLDGVEFAGAFDDVFTPDGSATSPGTTLLDPITSVFDLTAFIPSLYDGHLTVHLDTFAGTLKDFISIDYSELTIFTEVITIDEPGVLVLFGFGFLGLIGFHTIHLNADRRAVF